MHPNCTDVDICHIFLQYDQLLGRVLVNLTHWRCMWSIPEAVQPVTSLTWPDGHSARVWGGKSVWPQGQTESERDITCVLDACSRSGQLHVVAVSGGGLKGNVTAGLKCKSLFTCTWWNRAMEWEDCKNKKSLQFCNAQMFPCYRSQLCDLTRNAIFFITNLPPLPTLFNVKSHSFSFMPVLLSF